MAASAEVSAVIALGAGGFSFLSPCVLPLVPSYLSFVAGSSLEDLQDPKKLREVRSRVILRSLWFILGFSLVFLALGGSFSLAGRSLFQYQDIIRRIGGALIVLFGLAISGLIRFRPLMQMKQFQVKNRPGSYFGAFLVGVTFAVGWTPCVGPVLSSILLLATTSEEVRQGIFLLGLYSMGLAVPFFLSSLGINSFLRLFRRYRGLVPVIHTVGGIVLVVVGVLLLTNTFTVLNSYAIQITPRWLFERL